MRWHAEQKKCLERTPRQTNRQPAGLHTAQGRPYRCVHCESLAADLTLRLAALRLPLISGLALRLTLATEGRENLEPRGAVDHLSRWESGVLTLMLLLPLTLTLGLGLGLGLRLRLRLRLMRHNQTLHG